MVDLPISSRILAQLRQDYSRATLDENEKVIETMISMLRNLNKPNGTIIKFLNEVAQMIYRNFQIREISIGLKSVQDGCFRYVAFAGIRDDAQTSLKALTYTIDDFSPDSKYGGKTISSQTQAYLAEEQPFEQGEEGTYNRPVMLKQVRQSINQNLEADYFDTFIRNRENEIIGWIEYSGTKMNEFPDMHTVKEIEMLVFIISLALQTTVPL